MANALKERTLEKINSQLSHITSYRTRDGVMPLALKNQGKKPLFSAANEKFSIDVICRSEYDQQKLDIPISSYVELIRYIKRKYPVDKGNLVVVGNKNSNKNNQYDVTLYRLNFSPVTSTAVKAWIPESLLYYDVVENGQVASLQTPAGELFVGKVNDQLETGRRSPLLPNLERFAVAIGLDETAKQKQLNSQQVNTVIKDNLARAILKNALLLLSRKTEEKQPIRWQVPAIAVASMGVLYLAVTSIYLVAANAYYQSEFDKAQQQVDQLLNERQLISSNNEKVSQINELQSQFSNPLKLWPIVFELDETMDAYIDTVRWESDFIEISGMTTNEAPKLLNALLEQYQVEDAEFSGPVRRRGSRQSYSIRMSLDGGEQQ